MVVNPWVWRRPPWEGLQNDGANRTRQRLQDLSDQAVTVTLAGSSGGELVKERKRQRNRGSEGGRYRQTRARGTKGVYFMVITAQAGRQVRKNTIRNPKICVGFIMWIIKLLELGNFMPILFNFCCDSRAYSPCLLFIQLNWLGNWMSRSHNGFLI